MTSTVRDSGQTKGTTRDRWAEWVLVARDGGDRDVLAQRLPTLYEFRDRVLANASVQPGDVLLDVGTGNGLVGFGALDLVGPDGRVVFSDVSSDLVDECRRIAAGLGTAEQCRFEVAAAHDLEAIEDRSVDVVTLRSVLIYVEHKEHAFAEFFRVLRPGGRLSLFEPVNSFGGQEPDHLLFGLDVTPVATIAAKVKRVYEETVRQENDAMMNFDERDLLRYAEEAGFTEIRLDFHAQAAVTHPLPSVDWATMTKMSPNPLAPTLGEAIAMALTEDEASRLSDHVRSLVAGQDVTTTRDAKAYLSAVRR
jgi:arsenite methyltransferase